MAQEAVQSPKRPLQTIAAPDGVASSTAWCAPCGLTWHGPALSLPLLEGPARLLGSFLSLVICDWMFLHRFGVGSGTGGRQCTRIHAAQVLEQPAQTNLHRYHGTPNLLLNSPKELAATCRTITTSLQQGEADQQQPLAETFTMEPSANSVP